MRLIPLLLLPCLVLGSVRLGGIGPELAGLIDDPVDDLVRYPQRSCFQDGWLLGLELLPGGDYHLLGIRRGRLSLGADVSAWLGTPRDWKARATAVAAFRKHRLAFGGLVTVPLRVPSVYLRVQDWVMQTDQDYAALLGVTWIGQAIDVDAGLDVFGGRWSSWMQQGDSMHFLDHSWSTKSVRSSCRLTLNSDGWTLRGQGQYSPVFETLYFGVVDSIADRWTEHHAEVAAAVNRKLTSEALAVAGVVYRLKWWRWARQTDWYLGATTTFPAGVEFSTGILTLRVGAAFTAHGLQEFDRDLYAGLTLHPSKSVKLDFAIDTKEFTNLHGWELGALVAFQ